MAGPIGNAMRLVRRWSVDTLPMIACRASRLNGVAWGLFMAGRALRWDTWHGGVGQPPRWCSPPDAAECARWCVRLRHRRGRDRRGPGRRPCPGSQRGPVDIVHAVLDLPGSHRPRHSCSRRFAPSGRREAEERQPMAGKEIAARRAEDDDAIPEIPEIPDDRVHRLVSIASQRGEEPGAEPLAVMVALAQRCALDDLCPIHDMRSL